MIDKTKFCNTQNLNSNSVKYLCTECSISSARLKPPICLDTLSKGTECTMTPMQWRHCTSPFLIKNSRPPLHVLELIVRELTLLKFFPTCLRGSAKSVQIMLNIHLSEGPSSESANKSPNSSSV